MGFFQSDRKMSILKKLVISIIGSILVFFTVAVVIWGIVQSFRFVYGILPGYIGVPSLILGFITMFGFIFSFIQDFIQKELSNRSEEKSNGD